MFRVMASVFHCPAANRSADLTDESALFLLYQILLNGKETKRRNER
ncbi:hypothetical protein GK107_16000 [Geobacillus thermoleovorans]|nr:hypothetical protein GK107_16000 [Geobacillus thermoleovorans]